MRAVVLASVLVASACRSPGGCGAPAPADASPRDRAATASSGPLVDAVADFCRADFTPATLIERFAPGAVEAGGRTLPAGTAHVIHGEAVTTLYTSEPDLLVVWWPRPAGGGAVDEVHLVPGAPRIEYALLAERLGLGPGRLLEQTHPLGDLLHEHAYSCAAGRSLRVVVSEVSWKGGAVGKVGQVALYRLGSGQR
jgi:hypothetical protein